MFDLCFRFCSHRVKRYAYSSLVRGALFVTWISLWGRWSIRLLVVFLNACRPSFWYPDMVEAIALPIIQLLVNGLVHYRLRNRGPISQRLVLLLSASDVA